MLHLIAGGAIAGHPVSQGAGETIALASSPGRARVITWIAAPPEEQRKHAAPAQAPGK